MRGTSRLVRVVTDHGAFLLPIQRLDRDIGAQHPRCCQQRQDARIQVLLQPARLEKSIADNGMGLVTQASASRAAAARGVKIPGNAVLMVFRNDYAVCMLREGLGPRA